MLRSDFLDIDGTLYTCPAYVFEQIDSQVRHLGELRGITADEARTLVADFRKSMPQSTTDPKSVSEICSPALAYRYKKT